MGEGRIIGFSGEPERCERCGKLLVDEDGLTVDLHLVVCDGCVTELDEAPDG